MDLSHALDKLTSKSATFDNGGHGAAIINDNATTSNQALQFGLKHAENLNMSTAGSLTKSFENIGDTLIVILLVSLIVISIVGNLLVCVAVFTERKLRKLGNAFIVSLAIADLFVSCLVMTFALCNELLEYWPFGDYFCDIFISLDIMCCTASILNLCAISLDRFIMIKDCLLYNKLMTRKIALASLVLIWFISALVSFVPITLGWHKPDHQFSSSKQQTSVISDRPRSLYARALRIEQNSSEPTEIILAPNSNIKYENNNHDADDNDNIADFLQNMDTDPYDAELAPRTSSLFDDKLLVKLEQGNQSSASDHYNQAMDLNSRQANLNRLEEKKASKNGSMLRNQASSLIATINTKSKTLENNDHNSNNNNNSMEKIATLEDEIAQKRFKRDSAGTSNFKGKFSNKSKKMEKLKYDPSRSSHKSHFDYTTTNTEQQKKPLRSIQRSASDRLNETNNYRRQAASQTRDLSSSWPSSSANNKQANGISLSQETKNNIRQIWYNYLEQKQAKRRQIRDTGAQLQHDTTKNVQAKQEASEIATSIANNQWLANETLQIAPSMTIQPNHNQNRNQNQNTNQNTNQFLNQNQVPLPQCILTLTPTYAIVSSTISFYIPCIIMIGLYTKLYACAMKHVKNIQSISKAPAPILGIIKTPIVQQNSLQKSCMPIEKQQTNNSIELNVNVVDSSCKVNDCKLLDDATNEEVKPFLYLSNTNNNNNEPSNGHKQQQCEHARPSDNDNDPNINRPFETPTIDTNANVHANDDNSDVDGKMNKTIRFQAINDHDVHNHDKQTEYSLQSQRLLSHRDVNNSNQREQNKSILSPSNASVDANADADANANINANSSTNSNANANANNHNECKDNDDVINKSNRNKDDDNDNDNDNIHTDKQIGAKNKRPNKIMTMLMVRSKSNLSNGTGANSTPLATNKNNTQQTNTSQNLNTSGSGGGGTSHLATHKAAITLGFIMGTFLFCWVPFFCINIIKAFCSDCITSSMFRFFTWLGYANSALNPIIYGIHNSEFRCAFNRIFFKHLSLKNTSLSRRFSYDIRHNHQVRSHIQQRLSSAATTITTSLPNRTTTNNNGNGNGNNTRNKNQKSSLLS